MFESAWLSECCRHELFNEPLEVALEDVVSLDELVDIAKGNHDALLKINEFSRFAFDINSTGDLNGSKI